MKRSLLLAVLFSSLALAAPLRAEMCESTGEYEYTYGDAESVMSAKQRCENLAIRAAIEQCALFVSSTTNIENYELKDDLVNTLAAALVKQKRVLEQRVEGRTIYYRVSIKLDDEQMARAIEAEQARRGLSSGAAGAAAAQPVQQAPVQPVQININQTVQQTNTQTQATPPPTQDQGRRLDQLPVQEHAPRSYTVEHTNSLCLVLGQKSLKKEDWEPLEKQGLFGLRYAGAVGSLPLELTLDAFFSGKEDIVVFEWDGWLYDVPVTAATWELGAGVRYVLPGMGVLKPFGGAGVAYVGGSSEADATDNGGDKVIWTGGTMGMVVEAGAQVELGHFILGGAWRQSTAKPTLKPDDDSYNELKAACGGTSLLVNIGFAW